MKVTRKASIEQHHISIQSFVVVSTLCILPLSDALSIAVAFSPYVGLSATCIGNTTAFIGSQSMNLVALRGRAASSYSTRMTSASTCILLSTHYRMGRTRQVIRMRPALMVILHSIVIYVRTHFFEFKSRVGSVITNDSFAPSYALPLSTSDGVFDARGILLQGLRDEKIRKEKISDGPLRSFSIRIKSPPSQPQPCPRPPLPDPASA